MLEYLKNQIYLTQNNNSMFFENYAYSTALNLLEKKGIDFLKQAVNNALNDKLLNAQQKTFFVELSNKF